MNRRIHNLRMMLRKDSGAHFTYNLGVGFLRTGLLLLLAAAALFVCSRYNMLMSLSYAGEADAELMGYWHYFDAPFFIPGPDDIFADERYYLVLRFSLSGEVHEVMNYVSEDTYEAFKEKDLKSFTHLNVYKTAPEYGGYYLSEKNKSEALREARRARKPNKTGTNTSLVFLIIALPLILIGIREERLAMKYPRSDVPIEISGLPVPVYDTPEDAPAEPADHAPAIAIEDMSAQRKGGAPDE